MNKWVRKSIQIANSPGYLDNLHKVYPIIPGGQRKISDEEKKELLEAFKSDNDTELLKLLMNLDKFPIKDPYVAFLRKKKQFIDYNPMTVKRIIRRVRDLGFNGMIDGIEETKEFNRQIGSLFPRWIRKLGYPFLSKEKFSEYNGIAFLEGSDLQLQSYANNELGCELSKRPDLLAKVGDHFIVGEAKFLTDYGGHQSTQLSDALALLHGEKGNAIRIAILDGVVWIDKDVKMHRRIRNEEKPAFSALLFQEFLETDMQIS